MDRCRRIARISSTPYLAGQSLLYFQIHRVFLLWAKLTSIMWQPYLLLKESWPEASIFPWGNDFIRMPDSSPWYPAGKIRTGIHTSHLVPEHTPSTMLQSMSVVFHHDATGQSTILKWWLVCITFAPPAECIDQCSSNNFHIPRTSISKATAGSWRWTWRRSILRCGMIANSKGRCIVPAT